MKALLNLAGLAKSTYHYQITTKTINEKRDKDLLRMISNIFEKHHKKYGYVRITLELKSLGYHINKKKVARIMAKNHLSALPRPRQYHSYKGNVGVTASNIINRWFDERRPYARIGTDVTQFTTQFGKLYLSPIIDFHSREILAYDISERPNFNQIKRMLSQLEEKHGTYLRGIIFHSDQGWQYQMKHYQDFLKECGMIQSMSRKGNCLDNSPTENFFGRMKEEMFYGKEWSFTSLNDLKRKMDEYIKYYNEIRIVTKLRTSPIQYRKEIMRESDTMLI